MKKSYTKPELFYENFALLDSIAGCDMKSNFNEATGCEAYYDDLFEGWVFASATVGCTLISPKGGSICYGNPTPGFSIFSS
ncbi:MAG: hypothetical protein LBM28_06275 [Oscillospiraceae bacterium]|jgi:hypothetical protein|nr:hypothetical protein [Oscillospiraceae bacterium]